MRLMKSKEKKMKESIVKVYIKREELKDNSKNPSRNKVVEYKMKESDRWKAGKIIKAYALIIFPAFDRKI